MAKKRLNEDAIYSELRGQSAFFRKADPASMEPQSINEASAQSQSLHNTPISAPVVPPNRSEHTSPSLPQSPTSEALGTKIPERANDRTGERENGQQPERPNGRTDEKTNDRTTERANDRTDDRRSITRYSFEFYQDQIATLKKLSLEAQMRGEKGNISQMVREAVDVFIEQLRKRTTS